METAEERWLQWTRAIDKRFTDAACGETQDMRSCLQRITLLFAALLLCAVSPAVAQEGPRQISEIGTISEWPKLADFYSAQAGRSRGARVRFTQRDDRVSAQWLAPDGTPYGRGRYVWDPSTASFKGFTVLRTFCADENDQTRIKRVDIVVREELHTTDTAELRVRWTRPLGVNCATGEILYFKWADDVWSAPEGPPVIARGPS